MSRITTSTSLFCNISVSLTSEEQSTLQLFLRALPPKFRFSNIASLLHELSYGTPAGEWTETPKFATSQMIQADYSYAAMKDSPYGLPTLIGKWPNGGPMRVFVLTEHRGDRGWFEISRGSDANARGMFNRKAKLVPEPLSGLLFGVAACYDQELVEGFKAETALTTI